MTTQEKVLTAKHHLVLAEQLLGPESTKPKPSILIIRAALHEVRHANSLLQSANNDVSEGRGESVS